MLTILKKEIVAFFSSLMGYLVMLVFLLTTSLFLFVFPDTSLLDYGFATLDYLFTLAPWIFMFLIPAITMRLFSEELRSGTYEILATQPLTDLQIIIGKYFAALLLVIFALIPSLLYYFSIYKLGLPVGNIDTGATNGSYIGLILLAGSFVSIGLFTSSITNNQIVAFLLSIFLCFFTFTAFDYLSKLNIFYAKLDNLVENVGINAHYQSISRGVIDIRDVTYFLSFIAIFILLTKTVLESRKW